MVFGGFTRFLLIWVFVAGQQQTVFAFPNVPFLKTLEGHSKAWHVSASDFATCATVNGSIECVGVNTYGNALPTKIGPWTHVNTGVFHSCGIKFSGETNCWGMAWAGENMLITPDEQMCNVEVAFKHACGVSKTGIVKCWGGKNEHKNSPSEWLPYGNRVFVQVSTALKHTCAVFNDGALQCIGNNDYGQAPLDPTAEEEQVQCEDGNICTAIKFPEVGNGFMQVSNGAFHTCAALADGGIECWGRNDYQQAPFDRFYPIRQTAKFVQVSCGLYHCCAIRDDGAAECWGRKSVACTIHNHGTPMCEPYYFPGEGKKFVSISAGNFHTCAIDEEGEMQCWGANANFEGPRKTTSWKTETVQLKDKEYSPGTVPGSCQNLVFRRQSFAARVNEGGKCAQPRWLSMILVAIHVWFCLPLAGV